MCLIFVSYHHHPDYPLIVAANRDEFYARPSTPIHEWPDQPGVIAGRDQDKGGTWLGFARDGRFAAVTNFRSGQANENRLSRGQLALQLLTSEQPDHFINDELARTAPDYNDFNCLFYYRKQLYYLSNKADSHQAILSPGIYGLSNALLDTPWPKLIRGKAAFSRAITSVPDEPALWRTLADQTLAADNELPQTGVSQDWEKLLSSRFIQSPHYGTRSSHLLFWSATGTATFKERRFNASGLVGESMITSNIETG